MCQIKKITLSYYKDWIDPNLKTLMEFIKLLEDNKFRIIIILINKKTVQKNLINFF